MWDKDALVDQPKSESRLRDKGKAEVAWRSYSLDSALMTSAPVKMLYEAMWVEVFWKADTQMVRDFYWGKCLKDREGGAGERKWGYRWWCQSGPWRDQRERRMMWETPRMQCYSKKAPAKLIKSLQSETAHLGSPHPAEMGLPQYPALQSCSLGPALGKHGFHSGAILDPTGAISQPCSFWWKIWATHFYGFQADNLQKVMSKQPDNDSCENVCDSNTNSNESYSKRPLLSGWFWKSRDKSGFYL